MCIRDSYSGEALQTKLDNAPIGDVTGSGFNVAPVAVDDVYPGTIVSGQPVTLDAATLLANDYDPDGDNAALQITDVTLTSGEGTFVDNGDGSWTITPAPDFLGIRQTLVSLV